MASARHHVKNYSSVGRRQVWFGSEIGTCFFQDPILPWMQRNFGRSFELVMRWFIFCFKSTRSPCDIFHSLVL
jgi:hypothetical protein